MFYAARGWKRRQTDGDARVTLTFFLPALFYVRKCSGLEFDGSLVVVTVQSPHPVLHIPASTPLRIIILTIAYQLTRANSSLGAGGVMIAASCKFGFC